MADLDLLAELPALASRISELETDIARLRAEIGVLRQGDPEQLLDTPQAAALLCRSEAAIRQAARRGTLPAVRAGRLLRFKRGDLLRLLR